MKLSLKIIVLILCFTSQLNAQENRTIYFTANGTIVNSTIEAHFYQNIYKTKKGFDSETYGKKDDAWELDLRRKLIFKNDTTLKITTYQEGSAPSKTIRTIKQTSDSLFVFHDYKKNILISEGTSKSIYPIIKHGEIKNYYYQSGKLKSVVQYENNKLLSNERWKENGDKDISNVYSYADIMPMYINSLDDFRAYVQYNIRANELVQKKKVEGKTLVEFVIMENGSVNGINILKKTNPTVDQHLERIIQQSSSDWTPGLIDNKPVRVRYVLPVNFN
jgi:protein TonB